MNQPVKYLILDENHNVIETDAITWSDFLANPDNKQVLVTTQKDVMVSTVFLGLDHSLLGPPILFESMVFGGEYDGLQERYSSWNGAVTGHLRLVKRLFHVNTM